jgi:hypothetical protein
MNLKMSKNLSNFWDDCIEGKNLELNLLINSKNHISSNTNRTKQSTSTTNNNEIILVSTNKKNNNNSKIKQNYRNVNPILNQKKFYYKTKDFLEKYPSYKSIKTIKKSNNKNKTKLSDNTPGRSKQKIHNRSKQTINISSEEIKLRKNLSECTFHPKIVSRVKNRNLKEKLLNYSKFTMYERGQIFEMKKKEDGQRMYLELFKKKNNNYPYKPEIHKCPSFRKVIFNEGNYESLNYFYSRLNSARENKINKNKKIPFNIINYEEIYKNNSAYFNKSNRSVCHNNSNYSEISYIMPKKSNKYLVRNLSHSSLMAKVLNDKETEICKKNLHKALMELELNKK